MAKITKKEYQFKKQEMENMIKDLENEQRVYEKIIDRDAGKYALSEVGDKWNSAQDSIHELRQELKFLDDKWSTRNWTASEWNSWELVTNNID